MTDDKTALLDRLAKMRDKRDYHMRENKKLRERVRNQSAQLVALEEKLEQMKESMNGK